MEKITKPSFIVILLCILISLKIECAEVKTCSTTVTASSSGEICMLGRAMSAASDEVWMLDRATSASSGDVWMLDRATSASSGRTRALRNATSAAFDEVCILDRAMSAASDDVWMLDRATSASSGDVWMLDRAMSASSGRARPLRNATSAGSNVVCILNRAMSVASGRARMLGNATSADYGEVSMLGRATSAASGEVWMLKRATSASSSRTGVIASATSSTLAPWKRRFQIIEHGESCPKAEEIVWFRVRDLSRASPDTAPDFFMEFQRSDSPWYQRECCSRSIPSLRSRRGRTGGNRAGNAAQNQAQNQAQNEGNQAGANDLVNVAEDEWDRIFRTGDEVRVPLWVNLQTARIPDSFDLRIIKRISIRGCQNYAQLATLLYTKWSQYTKLDMPIPPHDLPSCWPGYTIHFWSRDDIYMHPNHMVFQNFIVQLRSIEVRPPKYYFPTILHTFRPYEGTKPGYALILVKEPEQVDVFAIDIYIEDVQNFDQFAARIRLAYEAYTCITNRGFCTLHNAWPGSLLKYGDRNGDLITSSLSWIDFKE